MCSFLTALLFSFTDKEFPIAPSSEVAMLKFKRHAAAICP